MTPTKAKGPITIVAGGSKSKDPMTVKAIDLGDEELNDQLHVIQDLETRLQRQRDSVLEEIGLRGLMEWKEDDDNNGRDLQGEQDERPGELTAQLVLDP